VHDCQCHAFDQRVFITSRRDTGGLLPSPVSGRYTYPIHTGDGRYTYRAGGVGVHVVAPRHAWLHRLVSGQLADQ